MLNKVSELPRLIWLRQPVLSPSVLGYCERSHVLVNGAVPISFWRKPTYIAPSIAVSLRIKHAVFICEITQASVYLKG